MKTLVTGGAGFIGYHLCRRLLQDGEEVICLDNLLTGTMAHVEALSVSKRFTFIRADVTDPIDLDVNRIYNLACPASPPAYQADPVKTTLTNVVGTCNMLELARRRRARILQASTSEIYGDPLVHPQSEDYRGNVDPLGPRACYDEGKRCAEALMDDFRRVHGVDIRIARIFNTYGPEMRHDDGRAVSNFIIEALTGQPIGIHGNGSHTRSLLYIDDLVDGLVRLMNHEPALPGPVNLGSNREVTILEIAGQVRELTGSTSGFVYLPEPINDPHRRCPDIRRAREVLGWTPSTEMEAGLLRTIDHFSNWLAKRAAGGSP